uniref:Tigger transposable element derived 3 n=1 Tax=Coturnix japonica TaxID=93934 RepID=A0A8C2T716_COTJA
MQLSTRKERKELSLTEKVRVLEVLEGPKVSQSELAKRFGVSQPQICRIIKNKERILSEWRRNGNPDRKRSRDGKDGDMEAALLRWVQGARNTQLPISGTWLHMKAKNLAQDVGTARCQHSNGCMARVRVAGISARLSAGISAGISAWISAGISARLSAGLSAQVTMLTLLLCTNADGSEKAALRAVGRRANPPYLHGINLQAVPWTYRGGGRLSAALFAEWLQDFNEEMQRKGKSVLLLAEEHEERPYLQLSNVRMLFMPPVATLAHPLHRGIARDLKGHYRRRLLTQVPVVLGSEPPTLLDALHVLAQAWGDVRPELITSCFRATNFSPDSCPDALPAPIWLGQEQLESFGVMDEGLDADMAEGEDWDGGTEESEDSAEPVAVRPCPSEPELWDSMATLRRFLECRATSPDLMQMFYTLQDAVHVVTARLCCAPAGRAEP